MTVATGSPPYGAYAAIVSAFGGGLAAAGVLAHLLHRDPGEHDALDFVVLGCATFTASRTIAPDEVTSFLRDPFVEGEAHEGGEDPVATGDLRQAIAANDWLQAGFAALTAKANELERG